MSQIILGVGEFGVCRSTGQSIKTYALGSCVALILMDPQTHTIAMDHIALPDSTINKKMAGDRPGYFADTGIPALLEKMRSLGCNAKGNRYIVKLVGGANVLDNKNTFNIGKRNVLAIKKILWQHGMGALAEDVGGKISRTVEVDVDKGRVLIATPGRPPWEI